ncbi:MAG: radical SAM protein [Chitinispirillaceae bacterium]|nr:radical SAM protein [Chitinispirillaceae bacterium]
MAYKHLFGPVQSRRLGVSLGLDLVKSNICSLNCVYCECGLTEKLTTERKEYVSADEIIVELTHYLASSPALDFITFGGSGEPTLNSGLGRVLAFIRNKYPQYRCALLTNGTLLWHPDVRKEILPFDVVLPSLDAVSDSVFSKINRPLRELDNARIIDGLVSFRDEYAGTILLEIFIVPGVNDTAEEIALFREACLRIRPDRVQLNTLDRPGPCAWVRPATPEQLGEIAKALFPLPVEIVSRSADTPAATSHRLKAASEESLLNLIFLRPSTVEEIAAAAGLTINQTGPILDALKASGAVMTRTVGSRTLFCAVKSR